MRIAARKGDLTISDDEGSVTLPQGQETTRQENPDQVNNNDQDKNKDQSKGKKNKKRAVGAAPAAGGGILNSPILIGGARRRSQALLPGCW